MTDVATPNLPSRDFDATVAFYGRIGFEATWRDAHWLILERGDVTLEFFPYPDLDPATSSFGACLRFDDVDAFFDACVAAGVPVKFTGWPRLQAVEPQHFGLRMGALIDPDGSLLRLLSND